MIYLNNGIIFEKLWILTDDFAPNFSLHFSWNLFISYLPMYWFIASSPMHICWCITTAVQTHSMIGCQCHLYPAHVRPTTIEQADHHVFCQPSDILIRLFKIHIQKTERNSWWLISVDLPFLYFLGEKSTPVVWKMHTMTVYSVCFLFWKMLSCHRCRCIFECLKFCILQ